LGSSFSLGVISKNLISSAGSHEKSKQGQGDWRRECLGPSEVDSFKESKLWGGKEETEKKKKHFQFIIAAALKKDPPGFIHNSCQVTGKS